MMNLKCVIVWGAWTMILFSALLAHADEVSQAPLGCPQCGVWRVTYSDSLPSLVGGWDALVGEVVVFDDKKVSIPGCGTFGYKAQTETKKPKGDRHYTYELSMSLKQAGESYLCGRRDGDEWMMSVLISGWFAEGGMANLVLRRTKESDPIFTLHAWNTDREDPCANGSTKATVDCLLLEKAVLEKMLSKEAEHILLASSKSKTTVQTTTFNFTRFSASVKAYCDRREKGYPLPRLTCEYGILTTKFKEFEAWKACMGSENKSVKCRMPTEHFDRNPMRSED